MADDGREIIGSAKHGLEALQFISEHSIDIVLTDIRMPFMDGIELMTILMRQQPFIRVIILSGYSDFEYAQKALQNGAVDYLLKPTKFDNLFQTFERLVQKLDAEKQEELRKSVLVRKEMLLSKLLREEFYPYYSGAGCRRMILSWDAQRVKFYSMASNILLR